MVTLSSGSSDRNSAPDEDAETLRRACMITGKDPAELDSSSDSDADSSGSDDIGLLRRIQDRFTSAVDSIPANLVYSRPTDTDVDEDDDMEILNAIRRKFSQFHADCTLKKPENCAHESGPDTVNHTSSVIGKHNELGESTPDSGSFLLSWKESRLSSQLAHCQFPKHIHSLFDVLKKNRSCQKLIRGKLLATEGKIEKNKELKNRVKCLLEFQLAGKKELVGHGTYLKRDPRINLISIPDTEAQNSQKTFSKKAPALLTGPAENVHVRHYKEVMKRFLLPFCKPKWSDFEKDKLLSGIKQQYQEMVLLSSMNFGSNEDGSDDPNSFALLSSADLEVTPEKIQSFLPLVDWNRLSSMYLPGCSGAECEARWLNCEDPFINRNPWTIMEDKKLLLIVQERGLFNWIDISIALGTHRTPFQCLARYQRSLNPHILNKEWTDEEDAMLRAAVENFGDNWQIVRSYLEGRTGSQCSYRWRVALNPNRRKVGRWSVDEDRRLKAAVMLFGAKNWNKIAQFAYGRTQVQCRERWFNCLDPSINLETWTAEEDVKLLKAIEEHGYSWSKVATSVPGRTDNQCTRRWRVLCPEQVPLLRAANQMKKTVLISNFVDRENERPQIGPNDFSPIICLPPENRCIKKNRNKKSRCKKPTANLDPENLAVGPPEMLCAADLDPVPAVDLDTSKFASTREKRKPTTNLDPENLAVDHSERLCATDLDHVPTVDFDSSKRASTRRKKKKTLTENVPYMFGVDCCQSIVEGGLQGSTAVTYQTDKIGFNPNSVEADHSDVPTADLVPVPTLDLGKSKYASIKRKRKNTLIENGPQRSTVQLCSTDQANLDVSAVNDMHYMKKKKNMPRKKRNVRSKSTRNGEGCVSVAIISEVSCDISSTELYTLPVSCACCNLLRWGK